MSLYHDSLDEIKNKCSSENLSLTGVSFEFDGRFVISSTRMRDLFLLGVVNSRSYS
jgi:hypothetical protein